MIIERQDIPQTDTGTLFKIAEDETFFLERAWAMEELSERAIDNRDLIQPLLKLIGSNIAVEGRNGTPLGMMAAWKLVDNPDDEMLREIAVAASSWSLWNQHDFFARCFEDSERIDAFDKMLSYGLRPKVKIDADGEVAPDMDSIDSTS